MRRILTAGMVLAAGALTVGPVASAAGAPALARQPSDRTFKVFAFGNGGFIPAPGTNPKRPSPGDEIVINSHLTLPFADDGKYKIIGHLSGTCTLTRVGRKFGALANCLVTAVLPNGSITTEGQLSFDRHFGRTDTAHLAITGGTGGFRSAGGAVQVAFGKKFNVLTFTIR
jgi:hypothetical protein